MKILRTLFVIPFLVISLFGNIQNQKIESELPFIQEKLSLSSDQSQALLELIDLTGCKLNESIIEDEGLLVAILSETNQKWRRKAYERWDCVDDLQMKDQRAYFINLIDKAGYLSAVFPSKDTYEHVLILGANQKTVESRINFLLNQIGLGRIKNINKIYLLGAERPLEDFEPLSTKLSTEMEMMIEVMDLVKENNPTLLQSIEIIPVNSPMKDNGKRATTVDTIISYKNTVSHLPNSILAVSNNPYILYQHNTIEFILGEGICETIGDKASDKTKISVALDAIHKSMWVKNQKMRH